jgi:hypothetical protein
MRYRNKLSKAQSRVVVQIQMKERPTIRKELKLMNNRIYYSQKAEELMKRQQAIGATIFLLVGLGIGAVLALLLAPNVGAKTRALLIEALEDGFKRGQDHILETTNELEQEYPNLRQRIEGLLGR